MKSPKLSIAVLFALALPACNGGGSVPPPIIVQKVQHLYVSGAGPAQKQIAVFSLPLNNSSTPAYNISANTALFGVCIDSKGDLFAIDQNAKAEYFAAPVSASSSPAAIFTSGNAPIGCAVDASGNLYVSDVVASAINVFKPPFSNSTTASFSMSTNVGQPRGLAFDASGRLFISNAADVGVISPPFSGGSSATLFGTAGGSGLNQGVVLDSAGNLYQSNGTGMGNMDVYTAPLNMSALTSNFHFTLPVSLGGPSEPYNAAFDQHGNMYVTGSVNGPALLEYTAPFSASSAPAVQLAISNGYGAAVGP